MRLALTLGLALSVSACSGSARFAPSPDEAQIVTTDLERFYAVFDTLPDTVALEDATRRFQDGYFEGATAGLRAFRDRTGSPREFTEAVLARRQFYSAIRDRVLDGATHRAVADSARGAYRALEAVYPEAQFPDVYFVVGRLGTGGTVKRAGLVLGTEHYSSGDDVPTDELTAWQKQAISPPTERLPLVVHELMHAQQRPRGRQQRTRLYEALREGCPDYLTERLIGRHPNQATEAWAESREAELWAEFEPGLDETDFGDWFYRTPADADRPVDLGYVVGAWICEAYVEQAPDLESALRDVIALEDAGRIYRESGYEGSRER